MFQTNCLFTALRNFLIASAILVLPCAVFGQSDPPADADAAAEEPENTGPDTDTITYSDLQTRAKMLVDRGEYVEALPFLLELITIFEDDEEQSERLESIYFFAAIGHMRTYSERGGAALRDAIELFDKWEAKFSENERYPSILFNRADCYRAMGELKKAAEDLTTMLTPPVSRMIASESLRRDGLERITIVYYALQDWTAGPRWFREFLDFTRDQEKQALAASALMQAAIANDRLDTVFDLLPFLVQDHPPRYDVSLNVALVKGGDRLRLNGRLLEANLLFHLALTKEEIVDYLENRKVETTANLERMRIVNPTSQRIPILENEVENYRQQLENLSNIQSYTSELKWRRAQIYMELERHNEAFWGFLRLIDEYPESQDRDQYILAAFTEGLKANMGERAIKLGRDYLANSENDEFRSIISIQMAEQFIEQEDFFSFYSLADEYLTQNPEDPISNRMAYMVGVARIKRLELEDLILNFESYLSRFPNAVARDAYVYWTALAYLYKGSPEDYKTAGELFTQVLEEFPDSPYAIDSQFRIGVINFGLSEFDAALANFKSFIEQYPDNALRGEAEAFLGDIYASQAKVPEAIMHYKLARDYSAKQNPPAMAFVNHAVFQMGRLYEKNNFHEQMAKVFQEYINQFPGRGDIPSAVFQLGRAKELLNRPEEMLQDYLNAIRIFGNRAAADGIDYIVKAYPEKFEEHRKQIDFNLEFRQKFLSDDNYRKKLITDRRFAYAEFRDMPLLDDDFEKSLLRDKDFREKVLKDRDFRDGILKEYIGMKQRFPREAPEDTLRELYNEAAEKDQRTLALRLLMTLDKIGQDIGNAATAFSESDLQAASPATLVWMGQRLAGSDDQLAEQALKRVIDAYPSSDSVLFALMALGDIAFDNGNFGAALTYFERAEEKFPASPEHTPTTVLKQGKVHLKMEQFESAMDDFKRILLVREWRGAANAEAQYQIGQVHYAQGNFSTARGFFQRVYVSYPYLHDLAARAYLNAGIALERMAEIADARKTYAEALDTSLNPDLPAKAPDIYEQIRARFNALPAPATVN